VLGLFALAEPSKYCGARKSPLPSDTPARQVAVLRKGLESLSRQAQEARDLLKGEHVLHRRARLLGDVDSTDLESIRKQLANDVLLAPPRRVDQPIQRGSLVAREPDV
jgi:hypothetical protein